MYNPFDLDETNETLIPEAYNKKMRINNKHRSVSATRRYVSEIRTIQQKRKKREVYLVLAGSVVAGLLFAHMGYMM